jgi:hypothetical protein
MGNKQNTYSNNYGTLIQSRLIFNIPANILHNLVAV